MTTDYRTALRKCDQDEAITAALLSLQPDDRARILRMVAKLRALSMKNNGAVLSQREALDALVKLGIFVKDHYIKP